jgi:hypothetical protein
MKHFSSLIFNETKTAKYRGQIQKTFEITGVYCHPKGALLTTRARAYVKLRCTTPDCGCEASKDPDGYYVTLQAFKDDAVRVCPLYKVRNKSRKWVNPPRANTAYCILDGERMRDVDASFALGKNKQYLQTIRKQGVPKKLTTRLELL